jgi:PPM family protein phosphatase
MEGQAAAGAAVRPYGVASRAGAGGRAEGTAALSDYSSRAAKGFICFMAVADGFGGPGLGDLASRLALDTIGGLLDPRAFENEGDFRRAAERLLADAVSAANEVLGKAAASGDKAGMGATITCAAVESENAFVAHIGNARAYLLTARGVRQITSDHLEQVDGSRTRLTRALGIGDHVEADILRVPLRPGEVLFVCSHGLYAALSTEQIVGTLASVPDLQAACEMLVEAAAARGPLADVSIAAWRVPGAEPVQPAQPASEQKVSRPRKRRRWLVALIALLVVAGGIAGWGLASGWFKAKAPVKNTGTQQQSGTRFGVGDVLQIDTTGAPDACYLMDYPGGAQQTRLYDGWKVRVLTSRSFKGEQWYRVEVVEGGLDNAGKRGYVAEEFLVEAP